MDDGIVTLSKTVDLMLSDDYKERFIAEYWQLLIRYEKLKTLLSDWDNGRLDFVPTCPRSIYNIQLNAMSDYIASLETRAVMEQIEL